MDPDSDDWIPLGKREEWSDVAPLPVDAGSVIAIKYTEQHRECMGYFRAIMQSGEKSRRALDLTQAMIALNSADYTAWTYRRAALAPAGLCWPLLAPPGPVAQPASPAKPRAHSRAAAAGAPAPTPTHAKRPCPRTRALRWECLQALGASLADEDGFMGLVASENGLKNYQLWNHRRKCAAAMGAANAPRELAFAAEALEQVGCFGGGGGGGGGGGVGWPGAGGCCEVA
jgi:hypothetical protein